MSFFEGSYTLFFYLLYCSITPLSCYSIAPYCNFQDKTMDETTTITAVLDTIQTLKEAGLVNDISQHNIACALLGLPLTSDNYIRIDPRLELPEQRRGRGVKGRVRQKMEGLLPGDVFVVYKYETTNEQSFRSKVWQIARSLGIKASVRVITHNDEPAYCVGRIS